MSHFEVSPVTRRTLMPHGVAFVRPDFPTEQYWSCSDMFPWVERGEDVEFTGELVVYDTEALYTGHHLEGIYEVYGSGAEELRGVTLLRAGAQPIGSVAAGVFSDIDSKGFTITTRDGVDLDEDRHTVTLDRTIREHAGVPVITSRTGYGNWPIGIDALVDSEHEVCGFIFNGTYDGNAYEDRIMTGETDRVNAQQLLDAARDLPAGGTLEVVSSNGTPLPPVGSAEPENGTLVVALMTPSDTFEPETVEEFVENVAQIPNYAGNVPLSERGVAVDLSGDGSRHAWVEALERRDDKIKLHLRDDRPLFDEPL